MKTKHYKRVWLIIVWHNQKVMQNEVERWCLLEHGKPPTHVFLEVAIIIG